MIPAILICVYVLYLYRELNRKPEEEQPDACEALSELTLRIEGLEKRLLTLSKK